jgi:tetratricopeptide (TPR) repeat protein
VRAQAPGKRKGLQDKFRLALSQHQQGKLADARRTYRDILRHDPVHFDALHMLGVLAMQTGHVEHAVDLMRKAVAVNGEVAFAHFNLGNGLRALDRLEDSLASYDAAIAVDPGFADAHAARGSLLQALGRHGDAVACFDRVIALKPRDSEGYFLRANALHRLQRSEEALASYDKVIALNPRLAEAHCNRGNLLQTLGRFDDAVASYDKAIALNPDYPEAHYNGGNALRNLKRPDEAVASYDRAIALRPDYVEAYNNRGLALEELGRPDEAIASFEKAVAVRPDFVAAHYDRAHALQALRRLGEAVAGYDRVVALQPDFVEAYNNRGLVLQAMRRFDDAIASFDRAIERRPDYADAHFNRGICLLLTGRFEEGWREYDWRSRASLHLATFPQRYPGVESADAAPDLAGQSVLLYQEQGLGDEIMFASMVPDAARTAARLVLMCEPRLKGLFARSFPGVEVVARGEAEPEGVERRYLIGSLGRVFRNRKEDFRGTPYLTADPVRVAAMRRRLDGLGEGCKLGIMWRGGVGGNNEALRSLALADMAAAMGTNGHWVSLNHLKTAGEEVAAFTAASGIAVHHWPEILQSPDYDDTAALLVALDAVFTVTCTIGHCCGALGTPVHVLVPRTPEWRYGTEGADIPWYRSMSMYRQDFDSGAWPMREVRAALGAG